MTDLRTMTLEKRVSNLEAELLKANERVRRTARAHALIAAGLAVFLIVLGWVVPTRAQPTAQTAPFTVKGANGERMVVEDNSTGTGLTLAFYNRGGSQVLTEGVSADGAGLLIAQSPDAAQRVVLGINPKGKTQVSFIDGGIARAVIGWGEETAGMGLSIYNPKGLVADLGEKSGNGYLVLADAQLTTRVEAGTEQNDNGAVKVYGPTGKCGVAQAGIPCMIVSR